MSAVTGFPGDHGRSRQDAAPEDPRRPARPARHRRRRDARARHRGDRPRRRESLSVRRDDRAGPAARSRTPSRTSTSAARPWCAPRRRTTTASPSWSTRSTTARCSRRWTATDGGDRDETRLRLATKAFAHTAQYDAMVASYLEARLAAPRRARRVPGPAARCSSASGSTCATARIRTSRRRSTSRPTRRARAIGSASQLQGKELSFNNIADADTAFECVRQFDGAGLRDRQARESLRRRGRGEHPRGLRPRLPHRPDLGVRRHHRLQPAARRRDGLGDPRAAVRRGDHRAGGRAGGARGLCAEGERAPARHRRRSRRATAASRCAASTAACWCRRATSAWCAPADFKVVTKRAPTAPELRRPDVRLAGLQVREVERHRLRDATA